MSPTTEQPRRNILAPKPYLYPPTITASEDLEWFDGLPGERLAIAVRSKDVAGRYAFMLVDAAPGAGTPLHYQREDEIFHIIEGVLTIECGRRLFEAGPGTTVVVPAQVEHRWRNATASTVRMLSVFSPGGVENLFPKVAGVTPKEVEFLAAGYGTIVTGPPMP